MRDYLQCVDALIHSLMLKLPGYYPTQSLPRLADTMPATVPDATEWSIDDVVQFFRDVGFTDQADVFREQVGIMLIIL